MDELATTIDQLDRQIGEATAADPVKGLEAIAGVKRILAIHQGDGVRAAVQQDHSWAEIGEALGVSKQAVHQRFAREWAATLKSELKAEHYAMKAALVAGATARAAESKAKRDAIIAELRGAGRARGRR
jgi:predicted DNA-binding protein YlxM (UPF0122 family)